ncbi:MAG: hypothetical protein CHACPFDD_00585 [Phycisphaerae bacterium]|nr:hypothetical protein [Phycisphaerae bacterium]
MDRLPSDTPGAYLHREHRIIERVLRVFDQLVRRAVESRNFEVEALSRCVTFLHAFADVCHHAKEEDVLFPVLEAHGIPRESGPIGVMLHEHRVGRALVSRMSAALDEVRRGVDDGVARFCGIAREYIELLRQHIFKEDHVLFRMADTVIPGAESATVCGRLCKVDCGTFAGHRRAELEQLADELERAWPPA